MITILAMMLSVALAKLRVMSPYELQSQFLGQNNSIPYSVANFGHIPWGRKLLGNVVLVEPFDACSPVKSNHPNMDKPFVLLRRGGCTFVTKVRNVQAIGAALAIIVDNEFEATQYLVMKDDGFGYTVNIPSIFIGENDGKIIEDFIRTEEAKPIPSHHTNPMKYHHPVLLSMNFDVQKSEFVSVFFGLTFQNRESFKLIRDFVPYYKELKDDKNIGFNVFYDQYVCPNCYLNNYSQPHPDCLGGGRYCQYDPDGDQVATGRNIMEEQLRQLCIFAVNQDHWWHYIPKFDRDCIKPQAYDVCSTEIQKHIGIDIQKVDECVRTSYNQSSGSSRPLQTNSILERQQTFKITSGMKFYPGAVINNQSYLGAIDANDIFGEICTSWTRRNQACNTYLNEQFTNNSNQGSSIGAIIAVVVLVLIVFFLFMVFIYRRMVRKEMSREMSSQVNQMVSQYISFYEAKEKRAPA